jgi:hypothetical protein
MSTILSAPWKATWLSAVTVETAGRACLEFIAMDAMIAIENMWRKRVSNGKLSEIANIRQQRQNSLLHVADDAVSLPAAAIV